MSSQEHDPKPADDAGKEQDSNTPREPLPETTDDEGRPLENPLGLSRRARKPAHHHNN